LAAGAVSGNFAPWRFFSSSRTIDNQALLLTDIDYDYTPSKSENKD
jgi:hypothetical protein